LALAALAACTRNPPQAEPPRAVRTWHLQADTDSAATEYAAEVRARNEAQLGFRVGGKLLTREVQLGQTVQAGQVLARLDPVDLQLAQQASQASLAAANTQWIQAQADFKRFQTLQTQGFISAAELERRQTALDAALAQRDQAQASSHVQGSRLTARGWSPRCWPILARWWLQAHRCCGWPRPGRVMRSSACLRIAWLRCGLCWAARGLCGCVWVLDPG